MQTKMVSKRIETLMHCKTLSKENVAAAAGVNVEEVDMWLQGDKEPGLDALFRLCMEYAVSADYLIGITKDQTPAIYAYDDVKTLRPLPDEYDSNMRMLRYALQDEAEKAGKDDDGCNENEWPFRCAAILPAAQREGILALIRLERQIYEWSRLCEDDEEAVHEDAFFEEDDVPDWIYAEDPEEAPYPRSDLDDLGDIDADDLEC